MPGLIIVNSGNLVHQGWMTLNDSVAVPENLTAFLEQFPEVVQRYDDGRISISDDLDGLHEPCDYVEDGTLCGSAALGTMLGFSRLNPDSVMGLWDRNMQAAMDHVLQINELYPGLIVAVSIEPENDMNHIRCLQNDCIPFADFSPLAIEEWRQWLSHTGIYGPDGEYAGQGADPWYPTVFDFNAATGSSFASWAEVDPRSPQAGPDVWDMYLDGGDGDGEWQSSNPPGSGHVQGWCERMVEHRCEDSVDLLWNVASAAGWSPAQIFTHQVPGGFVADALSPEDVPYWGYSHRLCTLAACAVEHGTPGITGFRETTVNLRLFEALQTQVSQDGAWANLEFNPLMHRYCEGYSTDYDLWSDAYRLNWESGARSLCAFRWWVPPETATWWANIRPEFHRPPPPEGTGDPTIEWESRLQATHDFVSDTALRFRPWSPDASLDDVADYRPPVPRLGDLQFDAEACVVSFCIDPKLFPSCERLLWYDDASHDAWPEEINVFGWPEFSAGHFSVYRDTMPSFTPSFLNLLEVLTVPTFVVADSALPAASGVFYAVVAVDNGGDRSDAARVWVAPQLVTVDSVTVSLWQDEQRDSTIVLANIGLKPVVIDSVGVSVQWLTVSEYPHTIAPNDSADLHLSFSPGDLVAGTYHGQLVVHSNDPFTPETVVPISMVVNALTADSAPQADRLLVTPQPAPLTMTLVWRPGLPNTPVCIELLDLAGRVAHRDEAFTDSQGVCEARILLEGRIPNGVYVTRLRAGDAVVQRRVVVLR